MRLVGLVELETYFDAIYERVANGNRHGCSASINQEKILELVLPDEEIAMLTDPPPEETSAPDTEIGFVDWFRKRYT